MYIDVHCHLTGDEYASLGGVEEVIKRAQDAGVCRMICSGFDLPSSYESANLAEKFESVYFCAGFHPSELKKYRDGDLDEIEKLGAHKKCVAIGEIGLDYHFDDNPPKEMQKEMFVRQLVLADKLGLPVVIHSRDGAQDTKLILEEHRALLKKSGLLHCYSYSPETAVELLGLNLYFSFGGTATFKNARKVQESVERIPVSRILSETDCPYLSPEPYRGVFPNEPQRILPIVKRLAELKGTDEETMKTRIYENAKTLFFKMNETTYLIGKER